MHRDLEGSQAPHIDQDIDTIVAIAQRIRDEMGGRKQPGRPALAKLARLILRTRRRRAHSLPGLDFGEPAWDILLDLYVSASVDQQVSVSSLCLASGVPPTTALRWIKTMTTQGHLIRRWDDSDGRRAFISLAPETLTALEAHLAELSKMLRDRS